MEPESEASRTKPPLEKLFNISCNWKIMNDKSIHNAITTAPCTQASNRINLDDVVSLDTSISLAARDQGEPCLLEIKSLTNLAISRVVVVSECSVLEFFKQCGEYATTVFAEFIDDFDGSSPVYMAETAIEPPSTESSIKFTKIKTRAPTMWIYGIKLYLTEIEAAPKVGVITYDVIRDLLSNYGGRSQPTVSAAGKMLEALKLTNDQDSPNVGEFFKFKEESRSKDTVKHCTSCARQTAAVEDIKNYIDTKLSEMEARLSEKMTETEHRTSRNLEAILTKLDFLIAKNIIAHN